MQPSAMEALAAGRQGRGFQVLRLRRGAAFAQDDISGWASAMRALAAGRRNSPLTSILSRGGEEEETTRHFARFVPGHLYSIQDVKRPCVVNQATPMLDLHPPTRSDLLTHGGEEIDLVAIPVVAIPVVGILVGRDPIVRRI